MRNLILGVGNDMLSDDGIGVRLVNDLYSRACCDGADFKTMAVAGLDILKTIENYDRLMIIDGIKTGNDVEGTIKVFELADCPPTLHLHGFHDTHITESVFLGMVTGIKVPETIFIITVEIFDDLTFSHTLSAPLEVAYPEILMQVQKLVETFIHSNITLQNHEKI